MTPEESKTRQRADAAARAAVASTSQINSIAPQVYRAPRINVPRDRHEFARLIEAELTKIEQAQSALLSLVRESNDGLRYVNGTIVIYAPKGRSYALQLEQLLRYVGARPGQ